MSMIKKTRGIIASCLLILLSLALASCELAGIGGITEPPAESAGVYIGGKRVKIALPDQDGGHYSRLSEEQKYIYAAALKAVESGETSIVFTDVDHEEYLGIYGGALTAMLSDHPEFFWLSGEASANSEFSLGSEKGNVTVELSSYSHWESADLDAAKKVFDAAVKKLAAEASELEDVFDRVKFVHDSIVLGAEYDDLAYETGSSARFELSNSAYGALIEGNALCGGYSRAFSLIMHELGIESFYVNGEADGGPHAWNVIKLGGEYYHIDLTWDDTDEDEYPAVYNYFCVTSEEMERTHTPDRDFAFLHTEATEYNYHVHESLYIREYSTEEIEKLYASRGDTDLFTVKFADGAVYEKAYDDLIRDRAFADIISPDDFYYIEDEMQLIITFIIS